MATTKAAKKALRAQIKQSLALLDAESISSQSQKAQEVILSLSEYKHAKSLSIYLSMPTGEVSTTLLVRDALQAGKAVFVPYMYKTPSDDTEKPSRIMDMLRLNSLEEYNNLAKDSWGIPTLPQNDIQQRENAMGGQGLTNTIQKRAHDGKLDMIVVPGVAFDHKMRRLGHGAGYYDSFLSRYNTADTRRPLLVGLCLAQQVLPEGEDVPVTDFDWNVDMVVSGDGQVLSPRGG